MIITFSIISIIAGSLIVLSPLNVFIRLIITNVRLIGINNKTERTSRFGVHGPDLKYLSQIRMAEIANAENTRVEIGLLTFIRINMFK